MYLKFKISLDLLFVQLNVFIIHCMKCFYFKPGPIPDFPPSQIQFGKNWLMRSEDNKGHEAGKMICDVEVNTGMCPGERC